jgi:serine kinase of HPr protein (carbohydrate metabolism regulator)
MPLVQASCVAIAERAVLIFGAPGSGKSSLALALIDRGAVLIGDDGVALEAVEGQLLASPPPNIAGLIEVRNVGLLTCPTAQGTPVALAIRLSHEAERLPERAEAFVCLGLGVPEIALWPDSPVLALRAEAALRRWGLPKRLDAPHIGGRS